tara:strand:+ start:1327 stop:2163 length:837 start_codon:yes stop_codon:yes gene_type:complete
MIKNKLRVLSLGAGVQSSTLAFMIQKGQVPMVDFAVFADTGGEPDNVYKWLDFIKNNVDYPVHVVQERNLEKDIVDAAEGKYNAFTIPFYTLNTKNGKKGFLRRQCTGHYKIKPIIKEVRRMLGYSKGERIPYKETKVEMVLGISLDEIVRMRDNELKYIENQYPLINDFRMKRHDCFMWLQNNNYPIPEKSACYFCPFHSHSTWVELKKKQPAEFLKAVEIDKRIRHQEIHKGKLDPEEFYLHNSCKPLEEVVHDDTQQDLFLDQFNNVCDEGMCGV